MATPISKTAARKAPPARKPGKAPIAYTVPGMEINDAQTVVGILQDRLNALTDLHLTLKHIHWNVVGPNFISVHTMLDPQVDAVREMADTAAERIATLGGSPEGTPGRLVASRSWDDYNLMRDDALAHLGALDVVYTGVNGDFRKAIDDTEDLDPVTQDLLIEMSESLEQYHWFVRAHLENSSGQLSTAGAGSERVAAARAPRTRNAR
ncbi:MAG: dps [Jatrophihabitantaceae bacterium]|nr:dps [Jatrophihabitantaceae bacterium]